MSTTWCGTLALNSAATTASTGSSTLQWAAFALPRMSSAVAARSFSHSDLPTLIPWAWRKVLAMPPPMISLSTLLTRLPRRSSLLETLAPPTAAQTGRFGEAVGQALSRGVGAVRGGKGVVHIDVTQHRQLVDEARLVLLLFLVEAQILEQQHLARLQCATGLPTASDKGSTSGLSDMSGTRLPSGRPKWLSTMTLAPLAASSASVGAARSIRVASVTLPACIGTLRSTRTSTRLPATSMESRVLKDAVGMNLLVLFA